jgi:Domain of unknown function (DUF4150)
MFASTQMGGLNLGIPDICLTPPIPEPIPYPNLSMGPMTAPACYNILMAGTPSHNLMDPVDISLGDTPGIAEGVASGTVMAPTRPVTGAFTVLVDGAPCTRLTTINIQNNTNCPGMRIVPSQPIVLVLAP